MEETLQLRDVLYMLQRRLRFIMMFVAACMTAALIFLIIAKPEYESVATLKYNPAQFNISKEKKSFSSDLFDRLITGEIAAVSSPAVLLRAIKNENLLVDPELNKKGLRYLVSGLLDMFQLYPKPDVSHDLWILERFKKRLKVVHPDRTNIISISYLSEDPEKSARVANSVTNIFLAQHLEDRMPTMPLAEKWLSDRKTSLRAKWRQSQGLVEKFKADNNLSYLSGKKLRDQHVDRLNAQLIKSSSRTEAARARVEKVRQLLKSRDYQQLANTERSNVLNRLRDRFAEASQREASLSSTLLPSHPSLREVKAEIASLSKQIENEGRRILDNLELTFQAARESERLIRKNSDMSIHGIQDAGASIVKLRELERTADSDREIYKSFLNRSNETLEQSTGQFANFRLIRVAQVPTKPSFPSKFKVLLLTAFGSVAAAVGLSFMRETLSDTFRSKADIRERLNLPVLAQLPELTDIDPQCAKSRGAPELVSVYLRGTPFAAAMKRLCQSLGAIDTHHSISTSNVIAITSTSDGEGKTMVAVSLAQTVAQSGLKTLLIDGNWAKSDVARIFGLRSRTRNGNGHSRSGSSEDVVFHYRETGLDIVPAIAGAGFSTRFADSPEFRHMLETARDQYDLIVIDTGAITTNSDSWSIVNAADEVVLVVEWNATQRDKVRLALAALEGSNARIRGVILNKVDSHHLTNDTESGLQAEAPLAAKVRTPAAGFDRPSDEHSPAHPFG